MKKFHYRQESFIKKSPEEIFLRHTVDDVFDIRLERLETPDGWKYYYAPGKQV